MVPPSMHEEQPWAAPNMHETCNMHEFSTTDIHLYIYIYIYVYMYI